MNQIPGICTFCGTGCGHIVSVKDSAISQVFPSRNHPVSKGRLCVRGWNIHELLNTPERITKPMVRKNGSLVESSYDEAISALLENFKKHSPSAAAVLGSPRSSNEEGYLLMKLARSVLGTGNISLDSESGHRNSLNVLHEGTGMAGMLGSIEEIGKAEFILVLGIDITRQNPIIGSEIHMAARSGATVVTMDSRRTQMARLSSRFLQIKPGTSKLALLAMARTLAEENLADRAFIDGHTEGYREFTRAFELMAETEVEQKTGVSINEIRTTARKLAAAKSAMVFFSSGISGLDADTIGYIYNLFLMAGQIGREGCGVNPVAGLNNLQGGYDMGVAPDLLTGFQKVSDPGAAKKFADAWGAGFYDGPGRPVYDLLADPSTPLRALLVADHDEGIIKYAEQIQKLDFVAYTGAFKNPFTELAHVVLPIASYIETDGTYTNTERRVQLSKQKTEPPRGVLPGWRLCGEIAGKAGTAWRYGSPSDVMDEIAKLTPAYAGISYAKLQARFGIQWPCDAENPDGTRRFDLARVGRKLKFATVTDIFEVPAAKEDFPILLMAGKAQHFWHQNNLMKKTHIPMREYNATLMDYPEGYIEISGAAAKKAGVRDRWPIKVVSPHGEMRVAARVSEDVSDDTAYAPYFVQDMITRFLLGHTETLRQGEDATIPIRIEKV
ncbi:MAG TPA: hypothetical protein ENN21_04190 [Spirochaetes bacterium]|nr:hypothetical protein [Spirochaetota bacterium]